MKGTDRLQFAKSLEMIAQLYRVVMTNEIAAMYFDALQDYEAQDVQAALRRATRQSKWFPKPAELRESIVAEIEREHRLWIKADNEKQRKAIADAQQKDPAPE